MFLHIEKQFLINERETKKKKPYDRSTTEKKPKINNMSRVVKQNSKVTTASSSKTSKSGRNNQGTASSFLTPVVRDDHSPYDDDETMPLLPLGETTNTTNTVSVHQVLIKSTNIIDSSTSIRPISFNPNYKENKNNNNNNNNKTLFNLSKLTNDDIDIVDGGRKHHDGSSDDGDVSLDIETGLLPQPPFEDKPSNNHFGSSLTQGRPNDFITDNSTSSSTTTGNTVVEEHVSSTDTTSTTRFCFASVRCFRSFFGIPYIHLISPFLLVTTLLAKIWQIFKDGVGENTIAVMAQFTSPVTGFFAGIFAYFSLQMSHAKTHEMLDGFGKRMDGLENRMDGLENRMDGLENRMDGLENRMEGLEKRMDVKKIRIYRTLPGDGYDYKEVFIQTEQILKEMDDITADNGGNVILYVAQREANKSNDTNPFNFDENPEVVEQLNRGLMKMFVWHLGRPVSVDRFMCLSLEEVFGGQVGGVLQLQITVR